MELLIALCLLFAMSGIIAAFFLALGSLLLYLLEKIHGKCS